MAAPKGNTNARKENRLWADAVRKCIVQGKHLDSLAKALVKKALEGDIVALKEIGDRIDGKVTQPIDGTLAQSITVELIRFADKPSQ